MTGYIVGLIGVWLFSDSMFSLLIYSDKRDARSAGQSFWRDHWIRVVRLALSLVLILIGATL